MGMATCGDFRGGESSDLERTGYACTSGGGVDGGDSGAGGVKTACFEPRFLTPLPLTPRARASAVRFDEPEVRREPGERWMR